MELGKIPRFWRALRKGKAKKKQPSVLFFFFLLHQCLAFYTLLSIWLALLAGNT
jgi:hypothetical protein